MFAERVYLNCLYLPDCGICEVGFLDLTIYLISWIFRIHYRSDAQAHPNLFTDICKVSAPSQLQKELPVLTFKIVNEMLVLSNSVDWFKQAGKARIISLSKYKKVSNFKLRRS
jgi:hypothetical protein